MSDCGIEVDASSASRLDFEAEEVLAPLPVCFLGSPVLLGGILFLFDYFVRVGCGCLLNFEPIVCLVIFH